MKLQLYSVRDTVAELFHAPRHLHNHAVAVRNFEQWLGPDDDQEGYVHPEDYNLYYVGEIDDETGIITALEEPELVMLGINAQRPERH